MSNSLCGVFEWCVCSQAALQEQVSLYMNMSGGACIQPEWLRVKTVSPSPLSCAVLCTKCWAGPCSHVSVTSQALPCWAGTRLHAVWLLMIMQAHIMSGVAMQRQSCCCYA